MAVKGVIRYVLVIIIIQQSLSLYSQVSELHLDDLANCIPAKHKDATYSIEQTYKDGVVLYVDVTQNSYTDQEKIDKLTSLFKIQTRTKLNLQGLWEQSDSVTKVNSNEYFTEASTAYKGLTDTINLTNPNFKSVKSALIAVEKSHQVIFLQKFGLQVLFGCVRESTGSLDQPKDIPDIVINIDMIKRFRTVWNEANAPMTYDKWVYTPTERTFFSTQSITDSYKNRFNEKKTDVGLIVSKQDFNSQSLLAVRVSKSSNNEVDAISDNDMSTSKRAVIEGKSIRSTADVKTDKEKKQDINTKVTTIDRTDKEKKQIFSIKGESNRLMINQNIQFEVKSLIAPIKVKTLGVDYFTIQIAASKNHMVTERIKKELYCSEYDILEKNEDGWYKYLVGQFTSIDSAVKFLSRPCFTRGFVSGYNKKGRVAIFSIKQPIIESPDTSTYSIVYRVQIAASKQPLPNETVAAIYKGYNPVNVSQEDGWYRYSIGDFIYFGEAKVTRDSCGTKDAFVMPYHNQKRIQWPRKEAMEFLKIKQNNNSIYVVQVVASRKPLSFQIIHDIIKVDYPLTMKYEDGWYKYFISAFTDLVVAKEIATKIGIKGAFIATYKNGLRLKP